MNTRAALRWAGAVLGVAVFALLVWRLAPHSQLLAQAWRGLSWLDLTLAVAGVMLAQLAFAAAWHRLLHAAGETGAFAGDAARWSVSLAGKYIPG